MKKLLPLLLVLSLAGFGGHKPAPTPTPLPSPTSTMTPSPVVTVTPTPEPTPGTPITGPVTLGWTRNYTAAMQVRAVDSITLLNRVAASECFKQGILSASMSETKGLTNQQVYDKLTKTPITINLIAYWKRSGTVGYTYSVNNEIYANFNNVGAGLRAPYNALKFETSLEYHETSHLLGFSHYSGKSSSVPYTINRIVESCADRL